MVRINHKARYLVYIFPIILITALLVFTNLFRGKLYVLKILEIERNNSLGKEIAGGIAKDFVTGDIEASSKIINSLNRDGSILYAIFFGSDGNFIGGFVNSDVRNTGFLKINIKTEDPSGALKVYLTHTPKRFKDVVDIIRIKFVQKIKDTTSEVGGVKLAFAFPFSRFERFFLISSGWIYSTGILFIVFLLGLLIHGFKRDMRSSYTSYSPRKSGVIGAIEAQIEETGKSPILKPKKSKVEEGVDLLSLEIEKNYKSQTREYTDDELTEIEDGWINLFNGWDVDEWEKRGNFYVSNNIIIGSPWQASLVRRDIENREYDFEFKVRKVTGTEGFVAIFKCGKKCHAWVLGGWGGNRSEVIRIKETQTETKIEKGRWHEVRISVGNIVEGFLNGEKIWSVPGRVLERNPSQNEFLHGVGFGVWSTMCKFKEVHYLKR